jgi:hypothetical protein
MEQETVNDVMLPKLRRKIYLRGGEPFFQSVPSCVWFPLAVGIGWGCFTPNPRLTICSILLVPLLFSLLWFRHEPPALLFACAVQWLQGTMAVFYADFRMLPVGDAVNLGGAKIAEATWLNIAGILALAGGMRLALLNRDRTLVEQVRREAHLIQPGRVFILYGVTFLFSALITPLALMAPRLTQPLLALTMIRWTTVFLFAYTVISNKRGWVLLNFVVCLEIVVGFSGFFADFKSIFFILLVALSGSSAAVKGWRLAHIVTVAVLVILFSIFWTAIKTEYRDFVNQGSRQQEVTVSAGKRLAKLIELGKQVDEASLRQALGELMLRLNCSEWFALTIENVPTFVPYENGRLWWGAIKQTLMPRLLFPNKPALHDSLRTMYYTGVDVAGPEEGTSIGIGYFAESYIDFGPIGMLAPIFLMGILYGALYRSFVHCSQRKILGLAAVVPVLISCGYAIESSNSKLLGGIVVVCLAMAVLLKVFGTRFWNFIVSSTTPRNSPN